MNKIKDINWYRNRVKVLRSKPQPIQRSPEWFKNRNTRVTASEVACCLTLSEEICKIYVDAFKLAKFKYNPNKCLSHYDTEEEYILKKCNAFYGENVFTDSVYTLHGKKYEEIATRYYRNKYNTDVIEFGLLPHPRLSWIGASPDGITPDGIMLEIKCPYSRKIDGVVPIHYWCQMQLQLEVCNLDTCDFLECEIKELSNEIEFINKRVIPEFQDRGILLNKVSEVDNSETKYIYPPDHLKTPEQFINWANQTIQNEMTQNNITVIPIYYFIEKANIIRVLRSKEWFNIVKPYIKKVHDRVRVFQTDPVAFNKYKESIHLLKNKSYLDKFHNTHCLITDNHDEEDFVIYDEEDFDTQMDVDLPIKNKPIDTDVCMISDT
jgi:putative phage-type endonuclease